MVSTDTRAAILDALKSRQSMSRMKPEMPPRELVERVIDAAVQAPNHYKTEPWRFFVLTGESRAKLGQVMAESLRQKLESPDSAEAQPLLEKERNKLLRAPVVVVVAVVPSDRPKVIEVEEIAAGAAAVQNMLLAAEAVGLGAMWRTGAPAYDPAVKQFLDLPENAHILAFVYLGFPDPLPIPPRVRTAEQHTTWLGWPETQ